MINRLIKSDLLLIIAIIPLIVDVLSEHTLEVFGTFNLLSILFSIALFYLFLRIRRYGKYIEKRSYTDYLTGAFNHRAFESNLEKEISRCSRLNNSLFLIYVDIDNFKVINDVHGHETGDTVLKEVSRLLDNKIRSATDSLYRVGGDEFAVIMPSSSDINSSFNYKEIFLTTRRYLQNYNADISVGFVQYINGESMRDFINRADKSMYRKKRNKKQNILEPDYI